jgi:RimJ/RimL family protein N-acetyltransferase
MDAAGPHLRPEPLESKRLLLAPVSVEDADEAVSTFDDAELHTYMGGVPSNLDELRERYFRQATGRSPDGSEDWLNWTVRSRESTRIVGIAQATRRHDGNGRVAEIAWVIAKPYQGQGLATEAAATVMAWLRTQGVVTFVAHIHPDHRASMKVAHHLGMRATEAVVDGEIRWTTTGT